MSDKTLMVYIGTAEDALHDFMQAWKTGKPAHPLKKDDNGLVFVPWDEIETHFKLAA